MDGSLGEKIGEGATADVHAWAPGQVVKLFRPGIPRRIAAHEAQMTRAICASGASAPDVFGEVTVDGRIGFVMTRLDGPTLMQRVKGKAASYAEAGAILADVLHAVHNTPPPPGIPSLRDYIAGGLRASRGVLPDHVVAGVLALMARLSPGDGLCHGDPNPGNVIMTVTGAKLIDWTSTMRAPPALDLAMAHVTLTELAPHVADDPERPPAVHAAMQAAYAGLIGRSPAALAAFVEPYLPLARALVLLGGAAPAHRERLVERLEADFSG